MFILSKTLIQNKEFLTTLAVISVCLVLLLAFPAENSAQNITKSFFFLVLLPALYIKFILKKNLAEYGLNVNNKKRGIVWGAFGLAFSLAIFYSLANYTSLSSNYILPAYAISDFRFFLLYELTFVLFFLFINEFFWRGFVLFSLSEKLFWLSVPTQALIYLTLAAITKTSLWQLAPYFILSVTSGIVAYKTKSIAFSFAAGMLFFIISDSYIVYSLK
ncbi:MAG: hypothetical protein QG620_168 [Patescibacteria group bacterium]|nr:hypothetical protein [Patescibacteria group bacterium]